MVVVKCNQGCAVASITIRDLPDSMLEKVRILSKRNRRSMNSELLTLIENALDDTRGIGHKGRISTEMQVEMWKFFAGKWEDARPTNEIIRDIYAQRTEGRSVEL